MENNENTYPVEVKLLKITSDAENLLEYAGRLCAATTDKTATVPGWIKKKIQLGHASIIEHASATFYIKASRVFTHEIVRHRIASYSQRSQRYVNESKPQYIFPPEISTDYQRNIFVDAMNLALAWVSYQTLLKSGIKPEIARYVLPNACQTEIICTWNFREIRHIIQLRTSPAALPEMRAVAGKIKVIMLEKAPGVFSDLA